MYKPMCIPWFAEIHIKTIIRSIQSPRIKNVKWNWVSRGSGHDCYSLSVRIHWDSQSVWFSTIAFYKYWQFIFEHVFWKWSKCVRKGDMDGENRHVCKQRRYCTVPCYPTHVEQAQSLIGVQWLTCGVQWDQSEYKGCVLPPWHKAQTLTASRSHTPCSQQLLLYTEKKAKKSVLRSTHSQRELNSLLHVVPYIG